ncbi:MAG TPA: response regulator transcription factor [Pyrinomonadaceae bacterium]|jgi:DNA-binding NarL/FixJ family response regulator
MAEKVIGTAIVERRPEWREKLVSLIDLIPGFFCTGDYGTLKDALAGFAAEPPDVVLCNFHFADASERKFVRALRKKHPALPILVLNFYDDGECIFDAPENANNYLLKLTLPAILVRERNKAERQVFDKIATSVIQLLNGFLAPAAVGYELTPHEARLLKLLVEGHNYRSAGKILNVSYNTVKFHMRRVFQKLEVNTKSAAVAKAMRHRLIK